METAVVKGLVFVPDENNMPFRVKDCALISRMAGIGNAMNLRELLERVGQAPVECLFHHFCETVLRPTFDDPEFHNDFAAWAAHNLRDRVLAERLAIINPYSLDSFEELRNQTVDIIEERLAENQQILWVPADQQFQFMQAVTVVFDTGVELQQPAELLPHLEQMSLGSVYYHFVEARRRTETRVDDFTAWLEDFGDETATLRDELASIDFYFLSLRELQRKLVEVVDANLKESGHAA